jgi:hypothetical protein
VPAEICQEKAIVRKSLFKAYLGSG